MVGQRELDADLIRAIVMPPGTSSDLRLRSFLSDPRLTTVAEHANQLIRRERLDAPEGSDAWVLISTAVREGMAAGEHEIDDMLAGRRSAIPPERLGRRESTAPRISKVVADYVNKLTAGRTIREAKGALASFVAVVGDPPLDEITRSDFIRFCEHEGSRTVGGKDPKSVVRPVSPDTLKKKVGLLRSAINRAIQRDPALGPNPAANLDASLFTKPVPRALMPEKRPLDVHELKLILQHPWFTGCASDTNTHEPGDYRLAGAHYWVPILAMYTGCRAGELGGLRLSEIRLEHEHPHIVIQDNEHRTVKGSYRRKVPVLDALLEHGFDRFVERVAQARQDRLFPDWKAPAVRVDASATAWSNGAIIRAFNRTVLPQQLKGILQAGVRQEVTFHGFRGAFKTLLGRQEYGIPTNYKHEIIGHAKDNLDKRYVREIDIADTYMAARHCRYRGLTLPPAP
jgi:integrase